MTVLTGSWLVDGLLLTVSLLYLLHLYISHTANHFLDRNIPFLRPFPFLGFLQLFTTSQHEMVKLLYNSFPDQRFFGYFQTRIPTLLVRDPDLVHRIMVKDFAHFHDRGFPTVKTDVLSQNLFNLKGQTWRALRQKLIPTFTTGKLKQMFEQLDKCGDNLKEDLERVAHSGEAVDARMFILNFSTEVIGSTTFGIDFSQNNPQGVEFVSKVKNIFPMNFRQLLIIFLLMVAPSIPSLLKLGPFTQNNTNYFLNLTKATKKYRKQNGVKRNDYFQLLMSLQDAEDGGKSAAPATADNSEEDALINQMEFVPQLSHGDTPEVLFTDEHMTAQAFIFLIAGSDSVSGTLSFILYHLGKDPVVQARLTEVVVTVLAKHGALTYQALKDMTYLDQVIQEAQRMYPIVPLTMRECTLPYPIPDSDVVLEKGDIVAIPVGGLMMDPKYHPSPEVFNPDRFADNHHKPNPTFMPFGDGPRICIAMRFAIVEMKVCIAKILAQYSIEVNSKTKEPFVFDKKSFFPRPIGGIWLNFKKHMEKPT